MGAVTAIPQDDPATGASNLLVIQELSKASMNVRSCTGDSDTTTVTLTMGGQNAVTPVDVVLLLDRSSSEDLTRIQEAAHLFLSHLNGGAGDQVSLITFADTATVDQPLTSDFGLIGDFIDSMEAGQLTALGDAMHLAIEQLESRRRGDAVQGIVILTDGGATTGVDPLAQADRAKRLGYPVYLVGISDKVNRGSLSQLASRAGGNFFATANDQSLIGVLKRLGRELLAEFITIKETLPDEFSYAGIPEGAFVPDVTVNTVNGTTDLFWELEALVNGQVWQTQFDIIANQVGTFNLHRFSELSYIQQSGERVFLTLDNPEVQVTGTPLPTALFDMNPVRPKANQTIEFFDRSVARGGSINSWNWNFGDGTTSTEQNPTHVYADIGRYTVALSVTDGNNCTVTHERTFRISEVVPGEVAPPPPRDPDGTTGTGTDNGNTGTTDGTGTDATFSIERSNAEISSGSAVTFSVAPADLATACAWTFGDGGTSNQCQATYTYVLGGTFTVSVTVTLADGGTRTLSQNVTVAQVNQKPTADFFVRPGNPRVGRPAGFDSSPSSDVDGNITAWSWDFGDGTTSDQASPIHEYAVPGMFTVTLTVTDNGGLVSDAVSREVFVGLSIRAFEALNPDRQRPEVPEWMEFYIDGGIVTDEELEDAARRFANGSFVQSTQYRLTEDDLRILTDLHDLRIVTRKYLNPEDAVADGYQPIGTFAPGRGQDYVNLELLNSEKPPVFNRIPILIYAPNEDGDLKLVGVRFVTFEEADTTLFGVGGWQTFNPPPPPGGPPPGAPSPGGVPGTIFVRTVWIWLENPEGMFTPFNPAIQ